MLSPSRWKNGCGSTRIVIYRSPGGPPLRPSLPLPATRSRAFDVTPCGIRTSTGSECEIRPSPLQVGQTFFSRPRPSQRGQVRLNFIAPAIWVTLPVPSHSGQTVVVPPTEPDPLHVSQISWRTTFKRTWVPRMDSQKSMLSPYSRSDPFSEVVAPDSPFRPPKNWLKISRKAPAPAAPPPGCCAPPCWFMYSEKSKPP